MTTIEFENCGDYITAFHNGIDRTVIVRCDFDKTDCGQNESLDSFVARHGGTAATATYLRDAYRAAVQS